MARKRLVAAPDCGLGLPSEKLVEAKLQVMCKVAGIFWKIILYIHFSS